MKSRRLIVIFQYEETRGRRVVVQCGRCISAAGDTIPWFRIARHVVVATVASLCREIAVREKFIEALN